ncbi:Putative RxLR effector [Phytophthora palmivora]|uniref:RxLR effector n=1 Tax=Phytophthora palmivora TaxID=4796 RepID=A0A2P4X0G9_9STRA|nr:Putative RxLR effector [Phytophthora palmivora]
MQLNYFLLSVALITVSLCNSIATAEVVTDTNRMLTSVQVEERISFPGLNTLKSAFRKTWAKSKDRHAKRVMDKMLKDNNNFIRH